MLARPNPTVSNCGLVIVQVDQQGHQQQNIRQQHREQHNPENRSICNNNALLTPQGIYNSVLKITLQYNLLLKLMYTLISNCRRPVLLCI